MKEILLQIFQRLVNLEKLLKGKDKELLNIEGCAAFLGISRSNLYGKVAQKSIPFYRLGNRILFRKSEILDNLINSNHRVKPISEIESEVSTTILKKKIGGAK